MFSTIVCIGKVNSISFFAKLQVLPSQKFDLDHPAPLSTDAIVFLTVDLRKRKGILLTENYLSSMRKLNH
jgi:hypothetical protein